MRRLVLFVEGEGDALAVPRLVGRLLNEKGAWDSVFLDDRTFRVGHFNRLLKNNYREWRRKLAASLKRPDVGAVLLILDGDAKWMGNDAFCAAAAAKLLAEEAMKVGAGATFSVAIVFARQEYESWLIASIESLDGKRLSDGRIIDLGKRQSLSKDLEESPRDAKGWLGHVVEGGYRPTRDQAALTELLDLKVLRDRKLRSFQRLESALDELVSACRNNAHVATPSDPNRESRNERKTQHFD